VRAVHDRNCVSSKSSKCKQSVNVESYAGWRNDRQLGKSSSCIAHLARLSTRSVHTSIDVSKNNTIFTSAASPTTDSQSIMGGRKRAHACFFSKRVLVSERTTQKQCVHSRCLMRAGEEDKERRA
jgi:hypothetical protein